MKYYSTNHISPDTDLRSAVLQSLPSDNGLYLPKNIPVLPHDFFNTLQEKSLQEIALEVINTLIGHTIPKNELELIINESFNFPVEINTVGNIQVTELWHGPTLAFKDFGARFMSKLFALFLKSDDKKITILTATSGDTGGAVASGFFNTPNIDVIVLYPKGQVSDFQERQITTWGNNITAISIDGTFDDCQSLVKQAFLKKEINDSLNLSSANSINLARLIPQMVYYFESVKQFIRKSKPIVVSVPSGNFGNLTAGVMAQKMGLPIDHFIASTNVNNIVPNYIKSGEYLPKKSISTISNAMDVGHPSNFPRLLALHNDDWSTLSKNISGHYITDEETLKVIEEIYQKYNYVLDPHSAISYDGLRSYMTRRDDIVGLSISTAHPIKFESAMAALNLKIDKPDSVHAFYEKEKIYDQLSSSFDEFERYLLNR